MALTDRQNSAVSVFSTLPAFEGWQPDEIASNLTEVFASGDSARIANATNAISGIQAYEGWAPEEIQSNIQEVFTPEPPPSPTNIEPTGFATPPPAIPAEETPLLRGEEGFEEQQPPPIEAPPPLTVPEFAQREGEAALKTVRIVASKLPTFSVDLLTFPVKLLSGAGAGLEALIFSGDPELAKDEFAAGFRGERDELGKGAAELTELAQESEQIIKGEVTTDRDRLVDRLVDDVITAAMITAGGAQLAKALPGIQATAKRGAQNILSKATNSVKVLDEVKLSPKEIANVRKALGEGGAKVKLTPKEQTFLNAARADGKRISGQILKKGTVTTDDLVYPWQKGKKFAQQAKNAAQKELKKIPARPTRPAPVPDEAVTQAPDELVTDVPATVEPAPPAPIEPTAPVAAPPIAPTTPLPIEGAPPVLEPPTPSKPNLISEETPGEPSPTKVITPEEQQAIDVEAQKFNLDPKEIDEGTFIPGRNPIRRAITDALSDADNPAIPPLEKRTVFFFDLDDTKSMNEIFGHEATDEVFESVGHLIKEHFSDAQMYGRQGGEEFAVILRQDQIPLVEAFIDDLTNNLTINDQAVTVSGGVGVGRTPDGKMVADALGTEAKELGKNKIIVDTPGQKKYNIEGADVLNQKEHVAIFDRQEGARRLENILKRPDVTAEETRLYKPVIERLKGEFQQRKDELVGRIAGQEVLSPEIRERFGRAVQKKPPKRTGLSTGETGTAVSTGKAPRGIETEVIKQTASPRKPTVVTEPSIEAPIRVPTAEFATQAGAVSVDFRQGPAEVSRLFKKYLGKGGLAPESVQQLDVQRKARMNRIARQASFDAVDMERAIKKVYGKKADEKTLARIDSAIKGDLDISSLPPEIQDIAQKFRDHMDALSRESINVGGVPESLVPVIEKNFGAYVRRAYQAHKDPKWAKKIPLDVRNTAHAFMSRELERAHLNTIVKQDELLGKKAKLEQGLKEPDSPNTDPVQIQKELDKVNRELEEIEVPLIELEPTLENIQGRLNAFLNKHEGIFETIEKTGKTGAKNLSLFKSRTGIPPELRAFLGEFQNPIVNYVNTVSHQAQLIANHSFLTQVRKTGLEEGWLKTRPITNDQGDFTTPIAGEESKVMEPLNGTFTTKDIANELNAAMKTNTVGPFMRFYMKIVGSVKYAKTVGGHITHIRNFLANPFISMAAGHWDLPKAWSAAKIVWTDLTNAPKPEYRDRLNRYIELGVVGDSARSEELREVFNDAIGNNWEDYVDNRLKKITRLPLKIATKLYQTEDDFWKIFGFESELAMLQKNFPEKSLDTLEKMAAKNVRKIYPYYSQVPRLVKNLKKVPLVGPFMSFPAEIIRGSAELAAMTKKELGSKTMKGVGVKRLAGIILAAGVPSAVGLYSRFASKITPDEEDDIRLFLPPWSQNSDVIWLGKPSQEKFRYVDVGYLDPYSYLKSPVMAMLRGENIDDKAIGALAEALSPFISEDLLLSKILDVRRNKTQQGKEVYNPSDPMEEKVKDIYLHFWDAIEPGTLSWMKRMYSASLGKNVNVYGKKYNPKVEALAGTLGQRISEIDVPTALGFKSAEFSKALKGVARTGFQKGEKVQKETLTRTLDDFYKIVRGARRLGLSDRQISLILKNARIQGDIVSVFSKGIYNENRERLIEFLMERSKKSREKREAARKAKEAQLKEARGK